MTPDEKQIHQKRVLRALQALANMASKVTEAANRIDMSALEAASRVAAGESFGEIGIAGAASDLGVLSARLVYRLAIALHAIEIAYDAETGVSQVSQYASDGD